MKARVPVERIEVRPFTIPTDAPEADGTATWNATTIVVVEAAAAGRTGLGYTYGHAAIAGLIETLLAPKLRGCEAFDPPAAHRVMQDAVRNDGRAGLAAAAISAIDVALWDLKAVLLDLPLAVLLGRHRDAVPIYGSGGFTSYDDGTLARQLAGWVEYQGCRWVKMKIGREPERDPARVAAAKAAIGDAKLFVDANGAYGAKQAQHFAKLFADQDVRWFEEPVSSDDLPGLKRVRDHVAAPMEIAAGEYGYSIDYFRRMLAAEAVDVQQADATRCGGVTGFMEAAVLCRAFHTPLSAHCAPALHRHLGCAVPGFRHVEWFHDHVRIEHMLFDGAPEPHDGTIAPDWSRPGLGLTLRRQDAERFAAGVTL